MHFPEVCIVSNEVRDDLKVSKDDTGVDGRRGTECNLNREKCTERSLSLDSESINTFGSQ